MRRSTLIATWSLSEGVSWILQLEKAADKDGSVKVMSMIVEDLWFEKVGGQPQLSRSAPMPTMNSSRAFPVLLSELLPQRVLWALESMGHRYGIF